MSISCVSFCCIAWNEMLWSACNPPIIRPVSCCGKKPFGTITYSTTFSPTVTSSTSITNAPWRSDQARVRS